MLQIVSTTFKNDFRDKAVADPTNLLRTNATTALEQGEWVVDNGSGADLFVRPGSSSVRGCYQVWSQKGDTSCQSLGKTTVYDLHEYEALTDMFVDGGSFSVGLPLTVKLGTCGGVSRAVLHPASSGDFVYGIVTGVPSANGGKLKFKRQLSHVPLA